MADGGAAAASATGEPTIDPTFFDLVVSGTGLAGSLIAAAAAARGKTVLHLDPNPFYGAHFASLSPTSLSSFLLQNAAPATAPPDRPPSDSSEYVAVDPEPRWLYSDVEVSGEAPEPSGRFLLDVCGPRVLYCAEPVVDVMVRSGASHHVGFTSVGASLFYWNGKLQTVPDSREAIFKDKSLKLAEKNQMMRFLKLMREHIQSEGREGKEGSKVAEQDLEIPFVEFLEKQRLPPKIKMIILYAIAMADYDQDNPESCEKLMKTKEGLKGLSLYSSSIGRFPGAVGPFIYPTYGQGELPQAFCRCAAVKGALYVLRMPISNLLFNKEDKRYKGVRLATGQDIFSHQLLMDLPLAVPSFLSADIQDGGYDGKTIIDVRQGSSMASKIARLVCLTETSLYRELSNILIVFPPRSLFPDQKTSVRALQLGSNVAVCPPEFFVVYLSVKCNDAVQGKDHLLAAMNTLFKLPGEEDDEKGGQNSRGADGGISNNESPDKPKPRLLWSALYMQEPAQGIVESFLQQVTVGSISSSPMPDGDLHYQNLLESTKKIFESMYPREEFFAAMLTHDDNDEVGISQD